MFQMGFFPDHKALEERQEHCRREEPTEEAAGEKSARNKDFKVAAPQALTGVR